MLLESFKRNLANSGAAATCSCSAAASDSLSFRRVYTDLAARLSPGGFKLTLMDPTVLQEIFKAFKMVHTLVLVAAGIGVFLGLRVWDLVRHAL